MGSGQDNLARKVITGGTWMLALRLSQKILGIARLFILARLLSPKDFGQLGIALAVLTALEIFSTTGFDTALIYKKEEVRDYFDSTWTISLVRGALIFLILYVSAPLMATYFAEPAVAEILRAIGITIVFRALTNVAIIDFSKEFNFNKLYIYHTAGTMVDFVVAVAVAIFYQSVWALVLGLLAGDFVRMVLSYILASYRPKISFDLAKCRDLFSYGKWIFSSNYIVFFLTQGQDLYVAKVLGTSLLGFYQMAYRISNITTTEITNVICQVTFPAYAKIHDDPERLRRSFAKVLKVNALVTFPTTCLILVLAPDFVAIFLGQKWLGIVPALQVLCVHGVVNSYNSILGSVFQGIGRPNLITHGSAFQLVLLILIIHPLSVEFSILGTALAITASSFMILLYLSKRLAGILHFGLSDYTKAMLIQFLGCVVMVACLSLLRSWHASTLPWFIVAVLVGTAVYFGAVLALDRQFEVGLKDIMRELLPMRVTGWLGW